MTPSRSFAVVTAVAAALVSGGIPPACAESLPGTLNTSPNGPPQSQNPAVARFLESPRVKAAFDAGVCGPRLTAQQFVYAAASTGGCGVPQGALLIEAIRNSPSVRADYRANACGLGLSPGQFVYSYVATGGCGATPEERRRIQDGVFRQQLTEGQQMMCRRKQHLVLGGGGRPDALVVNDSCYRDPPPTVLPADLSSAWGPSRPGRR